MEVDRDHINLSRDELHAIVTDAIGRAMSDQVIAPFRAYTAREAAALLGFSKWQTIYDIPENELPKCLVGPARKSIRYFGADLLAYLKGAPPIDVGVILDQLRSRISAPAPVRPMPGSKEPVRRL